jgi:hydrophobe/amphiphile efflux-1 (HAE1) family protein
VSRFFIDRPVFAWVIAIIIVIAGGLSITRLPVEQYPDLAPPSVQVNASYPGASAETVEESVTQVIEQAMKGIDNLEYMSGSSAQNGGGVSLTFAAGTNPDIAQVQVQNKLQQALRLLPQTVQQQGVNVTKATSGYLMMMMFSDKSGKMSAGDLGDYVVNTLQDPLARVQGVGNTQTFGAPYAMRIWLDPFKLTQFKLMPDDVRQALMTQNTQLSVGQLGALPAVAGQQINATITAQGRLRTPDQFRNIVLRVNTDGSMVRLADVARIELGQQNYDFIANFNGKPGVGLGVQLAPKANALETSDAVEAKLKELAQFFPPGMNYVIGVDTAEFVRLSIREVVYTLIMATVLVVLIMYLFLGNWHATLIPTIAVPVVLLGTFGVLSVFGYSINTLTMFAMVLAIGLLVDDAIVVVENVERLMHEEHLSARDATIKSMEQITGALMGVALVLAAVFVPMAFFSGASGVIYRQFSITIVSAMALSVAVALILTPAICANFLKATDIAAMSAGGGFFGRFNQGLRYVTRRYQSAVAALLRKPWLGYTAYGVLVLLAALLLWRLPTGFIPAEDQGGIIAQIQLPSGATVERTLKVQSQLSEILAREKGVRIYSQMSGFSFGAGNGQNVGSDFIRLTPWDARKSADQSASAIAARVMRAARSIRDANVFVFQQAAIRGLGTASGFDLELQDLAGVGHDGLVAARDKFIQLAQASPVLAQVRAGGSEDAAEFRIDIDQVKASALGLAPGDVSDTLSAALGGSYINDFVNNNRVKKVYMQADAPYRMQPGDLSFWHVRNRTGEMVPLSSIASAHWTRGPPRLERYNGSAALSLSGDAAEGYTTGQAIAEAERLLKQLPPGIGHEWSGASFEERKAGGQSTFLYTISIVFVFLCLAALYESWSLPFSVMLTVPVGVLGALLFTWLRGLSNDVYFQVALVTTIGLASKNAILIVEFARKLHLEGLELVDATLQAVRIRFRPILMTSLAFMLGVFPMVVAGGVGSGGRIAIGTGVFGGMFSATLLGIFIIPLFFVLVHSKLARRHTPARQPAASHLVPAAGAP